MVLTGCIGLQATNGGLSQIKWTSVRFAPVAAATAAGTIKRLARGSAGRAAAVPEQQRSSSAAVVISWVGVESWTSPTGGKPCSREASRAPPPRHSAAVPRHRDGQPSLAASPMQPPLTFCSPPSLSTAPSATSAASATVHLEAAAAQQDSGLSPSTRLVGRSARRHGPTRSPCCYFSCSSSPPAPVHPSHGPPAERPSDRTTAALAPLHHAHSPAADE